MEQKTGAARTTRTRLIAILSLLGATLFWAGNYVVGKSAIESMDPLSLVLLRWVIAFVPLLAIAQLTEHPDWRGVLRHWPWLLGLSALGLLGYNLLLYSALQFTDPFNASLINAFNPALITLAAAAVLHERLTPSAIVGVALALLGVLIVLSKGDLLSLLHTGFGTGQLLMVGAICVWTAYTILGRIAPPMPPVTSTALQAGITILVLAPISLATGGPTLPTTPESFGALLFIGIFPSVLSYLLWNRALTVIPPSRAGVFLNLLTVFTAVFTILSGQPYTAAQIIGGLVVIGGVVIANARAFRRPGSPAARAAR